MKHFKLVINLFLCLLMLAGCAQHTNNKGNDCRSINERRMRCDISFSGVAFKIDTSIDVFEPEKSNEIILKEKNASVAKAEKEAYEKILEEERKKQEEIEKLKQEVVEETTKNDEVNNITSNNDYKEENKPEIVIKEVLYARYSTTSLNVREGPSTSYEKIGSLEYNQKIHVNGEYEDWVRIEFNGSVGFVSVNYLSENKIEDKAIEQPEIKDDVTEETSKEENKEESLQVNNGNLVSFKSIQYRGTNVSSDISKIKVSDLNEILKGYVERIMNCIKYDNSFEVDISNFGWESYDEFDKVRTAINNTYFEYTWGLNVSYSSCDGDTYILYPTESKKKLDKNVEIKEAIKRAINSCAYQGMTEREAVIVINNYICNYIKYDDNANSLYDAAVNGRAICGGYAAMFNAMCRYVGIECYEEEGYSNKGINHVWNKVKIGDSWYYVDPTWNDSTDNEYLLSDTLWNNHIKK